MPLLILSSKADEHVPLLLPHLARRGADVRWIDPGDFPHLATVSVRYNPHQSLVTFDGECIDLANVNAVWFRRRNAPTIDDRITNPDDRRCITDVSEWLLLGLSDLLGEARWLPGTPRAEHDASNKVEQLARAPASGLGTPRTLITNDPSALLGFYEECDGRVVTKLVRYLHGVKDADGKWRSFYSRVLTRRDLHNMAALRHAPMILQEYVPKRLEIRATVVAHRVFAAEIDSQASRATRHDWRHSDIDRVAYRPHNLPASVQDACVRLVSSYDLTYGAIDLVLTPGGEYVFLELNPNGQWGFIELLAGLPIADAIAEVLVAN